jgi:hypothetical protein
MERSVFYDLDGNEHVKKDFDRHHVFAKSVMGKASRKWSSQNGLLLPMYHDWHNEGSHALHNNVPPAPKPIEPLRMAISQTLREPCEGTVYDRYLKVIQTVANIATTATGYRLSENAENVLLNLQEQTIYIMQGQVIKEQPLC